MEHVWNTFSPGEKFIWNAILGAIAVVGALWLPPSQTTIPLIIVKVFIFLFGLGFIQFQRSRNIDAAAFRRFGLILSNIFYGIVIIVVVGSIGYIAIETTKAAIGAIKLTNTQFDMEVWTPVMSAVLFFAVPAFTYTFFKDTATQILNDCRAFLNDFFVGAAPVFITSKPHFIATELIFTVIGFVIAGILIGLSNYYVSIL